MKPPESEDSRVSPPRRAAVVGLLLIVLLIVVGLLLTHILGGAARVQDCVIAGRTDCTSADSTSGGG